jgi:glycosyltransferase 2 family protein
VKTFIKTHSHRLRIVVSLIAILVVAYFITNSLIVNWQKLQDVTINFGLLSVVSIICFVGSVITTGVLWGSLLRRLSGEPISHKDSIRVQIASWLLKYIPGQVGSFTGKLAWGADKGFSKKTITVSFIYENVMLVIASTIPTLPILAFVFLGHLNSPSLALFLPFILAVPLIVLIWQPIFYRVINLAMRLIGKMPLEKEFFLNDLELLAQFFKFLLPRVLLALGFIAIAESVTDVSLSMYLGLGAAYVLAGVIGILVLFVPSGLGVREGIIILLLRVYFPFEIAFVIAALARLYATVADIILAVIYLGLVRLGKTK